jgi:hypothetical protein
MQLVKSLFNSPSVEAETLDSFNELAERRGELILIIPLFVTAIVPVEHVPQATWAFNFLSRLI